MIMLSFYGATVTATPFLAVLFVYVDVSTAANSTIQTSTFARAAHCPGKVISRGSRYQTSETRSLVDCIGTCRLSDACLSVVFNDVNKSCHLGNGKANGDCSNMIPDLTGSKYYEKRSGGQEVKNYTCSECPDGNCVNICQDCAELMMYGNVKEKGVFWIKPSGAPEPFRIFCSYPSGVTGLGKILDRFDPNFDFNRTWLEYRDGFGVIDTTSDYWIGLKNIHYLTSTKAAKLKIRADLNFNTTLNQNYYGFVLNDEAEGYSMAFSSARPGGFGDCLGDLQGVAFSTYDVDNDGSDNVNCALQHGGGWWFKGDNCSTCNPLGPILAPYDGLRKGVMGEFFWTNNLGNQIPVRIRMYLVFL